MTSDLATKKDVLLRRQDLQDFGRQMNARFDGLEDRLTLRLQNMEYRIVFKLGALMAALLGLSIARLK
jgi:hypothetical protein